MAHLIQKPTLMSWSSIAETEINIEKLRLLCSHTNILQREGYVTRNLSGEKLVSKLRCKHCGNKMREPRTVVFSESSRASRSVEKGRAIELSNGGQKVSRRSLCEFHPGRVHNLHFTCCQAHVSVQRGCHINIAHVAPDNYKQVLELEWTYFSTPVWRNTPSSSPTTSVRQSSKPRLNNITASKMRTAIALDCEFGISVNNEPELVRLTAIDFFTKEILIDSLVKPDKIIKNYMTRYSGITAADLRDAVRNRSCLFGRDAARKKLFEFVSPETIVVMHGGSSDMSCLRWIHPHIVDTCVLETYFNPLLGGRSLKNLCEKKLNLKIQAGRGHDSQEDALACRELAIWLLNIIPDV